MAPPVLVCGGVIMKSGMILLCRRGPGRRHAGLWEFPGGRVEEGETPRDALVRELREELGIEAAVGDEAGRAEREGVILAAFLVPSFTGTPELRVHDAFKWVEARRLLEHEMPPVDVPIAAALAAHRRRGRYEGTHPKSFGQKYKELSGDAEAAAKAMARGSTPAGAHVPVMLPEVLAALAPLKGALVLDCTLGWGGHAEALLRAGAGVLGLDRDGEELARTSARLDDLGLTVETVRSDYADADAALKALGRGPADALLADLGVSSMQLDRPERGMSFKADGPLDMRMDRSRGPTAAEWLAAAPEAEVAQALRSYGDEPDAARLAAALKAAAPRTTKELSALVLRVKGLDERFRKKDASAVHPAARVFQALRIAVNGERDSLRRLLADLPVLLRPGGRLALLTFHSGEERLVGSALEEQAARGLWAAPPGPPLKPSPEETRANPRARSARLWRAVRAAGK